MPDFLTEKVIFFLILMISVTMHEFGHAFSADKLGDPGPRSDGRITMNPIAHIDLFGTVIFPLIFITMGIPFLFGWGKPVETNSKYYKKKSFGEIVVSLSGPAMNLIMCLIGSLLFAIFPQKKFLLNFIFINSCLLLFNLIPIPPLDGSRILKNLTNMTEVAFQKMSRFSWVIIPLFLFTPISSIFLFLVESMVSVNLYLGFLVKSFLKL